MNDTVEIVGGNIFSNVGSGAQGNGGLVTINAGSLSQTEGGQIQSSVLEADGEIIAGRGNAGNVIVDVEQNVLISGSNQDGLRSAIFSDTEEGSEGNAGNIEIEAGSLTINGGFLETSTDGQGNAGNITLNIDGAVNLTNNADIFSTVDSNAITEEGTRSTVTINAGSLSIANGASSISTTTLGQGNAGNITLDIINTTELTTGNILSQVGEMGVGEGGNITLNTSNLSLLDGAQITAGVFGTGNAGTVTVNALGDITFQGVNPNGGNPSGILNNIAPGGNGNAGDIQVETANLNLVDGGSITSDVFGAGNAGSININVQESVSFVGSGSRASSVLGTGATGNAGNISISAGSFTLSDQANLRSSTFGIGNSGQIDITTQGAVELTNGSNIFNNVESGAQGDSLGITIDAQSLSVANGSQIQTIVRGSTEENPSFGQGTAGDITLNIVDSIEMRNGDIFSNVGRGARGSGGLVTINAGSLFQTEGSQIRTSLLGNNERLDGEIGNAGNIIIDIEESVTISGSNQGGFPSAILSNVQQGTEGNAGNINISAGSFSLSDQAELDSSTFGEGNAGQIQITTVGAVKLTDGSTIFNNVERGAEGDSQGITIDAQSLSVANGSQIQTLVRGSTDENPNFGQGTAGDININVQESVSFVDSGSRATSELETGATGNAGNISITAGSFSLSEQAELDSSTNGQGNAGNVSLNINGAVNLTNDSQISSTIGSDAVVDERFRSTVSINAGSLSIADGESFISTSTFGQGNAGNVVLDINETVEINGGNIFSTVEAGASGDGGNIAIEAKSFSLNEGGNLQTLVRSADDVLPGGIGNAGKVTLKVLDAVTISGQNSNGISSQITSQLGESAEGNAGNITINANSLTLSDNGLIESSNLGRGNGGTIEVIADNLNLENQGQILAVTTSQQQEDITIAPSEINLFIDDTVTLKGNSTISAEASNSANGGNITIDANGFVIAFPSEGIGNDIRANADGEGSGGEINITAQEIFGLSEARGTSDVENNSNDIDASSEDGNSDGEVTLNTPDTNSIQGANELPTNIIEPNQNVAQACANRRDRGLASNFVIKGRGGVPNSPVAPLGSEVITVNGEVANNSHNSYAIPTSYGYITPARGIIKTAEGKIILTATPVSRGTSRSASGSLNCG